MIFDFGNTRNQKFNKRAKTGYNTLRPNRQLYSISNERWTTSHPLSRGSNEQSLRSSKQYISQTLKSALRESHQYSTKQLWDNQESANLNFDSIDSNPKLETGAIEKVQISPKNDYYSPKNLKSTSPYKTFTNGFASSDDYHNGTYHLIRVNIKTPFLSK